MSRRRRRSKAEIAAARYGRMLARGFAPDQVPLSIRQAVMLGCCAGAVWLGHVTLAEVPNGWRADVCRLLAHAAAAGQAPPWVVQALAWGPSPPTRDGGRPCA